MEDKVYDNLVEKHGYGFGKEDMPKLEAAMQDIAKEYDLSTTQARRYIGFMTMWIREENEYFSLDYLLEWAERFKEGDEYGSASDSKKVYLRKVDEVMA